MYLHKNDVNEELKKFNRIHNMCQDVTTENWMHHKCVFLNTKVCLSEESTHTVLLTCSLKLFRGEERRGGERREEERFCYLGK